MEQVSCGERQAASNQDYQQYDRIWQRVSPELNPYPTVQTESAQTAANSLQTAGARMEESPGTDFGPCCMGTEAQQSLEIIRGFINWECQQRCVYLAQARRLQRTDRAALLRRMAEQSLLHIRKLMAAYYLITGQCCRPMVQVSSVPEISWCQMLREFYHDESCDCINYRRAADETTDVCLTELFQELSDNSQGQANELFQELTKLMCRQSR